MTCPLCGFPWIPGLTSCANCGDTDAPAPEALPTQLDGATLQRDTVLAQRVVRRQTEAQALEAVGDLDAACTIYEALCTGGCPWALPYQRLAIIYRKAQRAGDEERIVRTALAHLGPHANGPFIVRLAKILGTRKGRDM